MVEAYYDQPLQTTVRIETEKPKVGSLSEMTVAYFVEALPHGSS